MTHSFDVELAQIFGLEEAIILQHLEFWWKRKSQNGTQPHADGLYYSYNTVKSWCALFPYVTEKTMRRLLEKLESERLIRTAFLAENVRDRTKFYALTDKGVLSVKKQFLEAEKCDELGDYICPNCVLAFAQKGNCSFAQKGNCSYTNISNTNINKRKEKENFENQKKEVLESTPLFSGVAQKDFTGGASFQNIDSEHSKILTATECIGLIKECCTSDIFDMYAQKERYDVAAGTYEDVIRDYFLANNQNLSFQGDPTANFNRLFGGFLRNRKQAFENQKIAHSKPVKGTVLSAFKSSNFISNFDK